MKSQWNGLLFWIGAILLVVLVTIFYQPAAARTGSLLVWTNERVYVMDIDTLTLERVAPAPAGKPIAVSAGCYQHLAEPCRVLVSDRLYTIEMTAGGSNVTDTRLPVESGYHWEDAAVSWSPDGRHLAYSLRHKQNGQAELRIIDTATGQFTLRAEDVDPEVAVAWTPACAAGLTDPGCQVGYKKMAGQQVQGGFLATLVGYAPASQQVQQWSITPERIFDLRWGPDDMLLYSRPQRNFRRADDHTPVSPLPPGSQLGNLSPDGRFTVYYQPFTLEGCAPTEGEAGCMHVGVWLEGVDQPERNLIYNVNLAEQQGGLNFVPAWSPAGNTFVFFQDGKLVHYDLDSSEATIWYKPVLGKLRSAPVFSPNEAAVAFVDDQGQGYSDYRLVVVNPRLQPVEHVIQTGQGFRVLAWLPD